jgi:hypothetical protein
MAEELIPLRLTTRGGMETKHRAVRDLEHTTLCQAFGLDPVRHRWDLPRSVHGSRRYVESHSGRVVEGFLMRDGEPVGKLTVCWETEKFRDYDPVTEWDKCG